LSYDTEDVVDNFLLHVGGSEAAATSSDGFRGFMKKVGSKFRKAKNCHEIADAIRDIKLQIEEVAARRDRYRIDDAVSRPVAETSIMNTIDPRLRALYTEAAELVGIDGKRDQELIDLLSKGDDLSRKKLQIVSVVGFGGLGKTTLVRAVHDKIKGDFDCAAFVSVGRNASPKKVFMDILIDLGHSNSNLSISSETQLIDRLRQFLENKRYASLACPKIS
jgi:disease resistance protein RPM1